MQVIPAIDIRGGRCARLFKGDYAQETVFDNDPVDAALRWVDMGAQRLHVIDLDGAKDGQRINAETVARVARSVDVPIQMGGGIRSVDDADAVLQIGVNMVIFGTTAVEDPDAVQASAEAFGEERVCVSVDAKDGVVRTRGWLTETSLLALDLLVEMSDRRKIPELHLHGHCSGRDVVPSELRRGERGGERDRISSYGCRRNRDG